jgi:hypothetical protein
MTAYKPTVRDMVARQALNLFGDTYANRKLMRNMFGSSGIGSTGEASLADFTPASVGFAADEAGRLAGQGRPLQAAANLALAAVPIPAVAKGAKGMIGKGMKAVEKKAAPFIEAYHGSPHTFDKFSLDKIGTGEGAQAYGHGLYFAENEGVAKAYRDDLTASRVGGAKRVLDKVGGDIDAAIANRKAEISRLMSLPNAGNDEKRRDTFVRLAEESLAELQAMKQGGGPRKGSMYQVRINADPNEFIDWDAPLSAQHPKVQGALGWQPGQMDEAAGAKLGRGYNNEMFGGDLAGKDRAAPHELSSALAEKGIPGIRYLDRDSRGVGEGSRNLVVFDPRIIDIMKRYGVAAPVAAAILAGTVPRPAEAKDQPNLFRQPGQ